MTEWMNECGVMVEWYWQAKYEVLGEKLYQCHFIHHKLYKDLTGIEHGRQGWEERNKVYVYLK